MMGAKLYNVTVGSDSTIMMLGSSWTGCRVLWCFCGIDVMAALYFGTLAIRVGDGDGLAAQRCTDVRLGAWENTDVGQLLGAGWNALWRRWAAGSGAGKLRRYCPCGTHLQCEPGTW